MGKKYVLFIGSTETGLAIEKYLEFSFHSHKYSCRLILVSK